MAIEFNRFVGIIEYIDYKKYGSCISKNKSCAKE